jgi:hypothetical protein
MVAAPAALQQQQCGTPAHPIDGLKNVLIWSSCKWISLDVSGHPSEGNSLLDQKLDHSVDAHGFPWPSVE